MRGEAAAAVVRARRGGFLFSAPPENSLSSASGNAPSAPAGSSLRQAVTLSRTGARGSGGRSPGAERASAALKDREKKSRADGEEAKGGRRSSDLCPCLSLSSSLRLLLRVPSSPPPRWTRWSRLLKPWPPAIGVGPAEPRQRTRRARDESGQIESRHERRIRRK